MCNTFRAIGPKRKYFQLLTRRVLHKISCSLPREFMMMAGGVPQVSDWPLDSCGLFANENCKTHVWNRVNISLEIPDARQCHKHCNSYIVNLPNFKVIVFCLAKFTYIFGLFWTFFGFFLSWFQVEKNSYWSTQTETQTGAFKFLKFRMEQPNIF